MCELINNDIMQEDFTMGKYIFDKGNGLWYELQGDYHIHYLTVPAEEGRTMEIANHNLVGA